MSIPNAPKRPTNRPGLAQIAYRIGDYSSFRERLLEHLIRYLPELKTRDPQDPAIAILDAWAVVADVLSFYQERIANEGYLLTATERRSVLELARTIGYELKPGVAASTHLAFLVEDIPNEPRTVTIPKGTQIMSVPNEGESPQTFETSAKIVARLDWNRLTPRQGRPHQITDSTHQLYLAGIATQLEPGDSILLLDLEALEVARYLLTLTDVVAIPEAGHTLVTWEPPLKLDAPLRQPQVFAFRQQAALFGHLAPNWQDVPDEIKRSAGGTLKGGVFYTIDQGDRWFPLNQGLPNADILCLAVQNNLFLAGTPGLGIFRSLNRGETWTQIVAGLTNLTVQTLYVDWERVYIYAGTPGGGVFRSTDGGENWSSIGEGTIRVEPVDESDGNAVETVNTGLPNTVVRSLVTCNAPKRQGSGTISNNAFERKLTGTDTRFNTELRVGDSITAADGQVRSVTEINDDTSLTVDYFFHPPLPDNTVFFIGGTYLFAGTEAGIYRSPDEGKNWYLKGLSNRVIRALLVSYRATNQGTGTIASENTTVTGFDTKFLTELQEGDRIVADGQTKTIEAIASDTELTIDSTFSSDLDSAVSYTILYPSQGIGKITSTGTQVTGENTKFLTELQKGDRIVADGQTKTIEAIASNTELTIDSSFSPNLGSAVSYTILAVGRTYIFAGTDNGIFRSSDYGESWESVSDDLSNKDITSLATDFKVGMGTITSESTDATVTGNSTAFVNELKSGDTIVAAGQTRVVTNISSETELTVDNAFDPNLPVGTPFAIANRTALFAATAGGGIFRSRNNGRNWESADLSNLTISSLVVEASLGTGKITSNGTRVEGDGTLFDRELRVGDTITAVGQTRAVTRIDADRPNEVLSIDRAFAPDPLSAQTSFTINHLFAGTADGGVFRSVDWGDNWMEINGEEAAISPTRGLATKEITALAIAKETLLAGTRFSGFVEQEWRGFQLAPDRIDLDTLYTGILEASWVVLVDGDRFTAHQVERVSDRARRDFLLVTTITSIIPSEPVPTPSDFGLRTTTVLVQSEPLAMAQESLSVSSQQQQIFLDPIAKHRVFLSEFVRGLEQGQPLIASGKRIRARVNLGGMARSQNWKLVIDAELGERTIQAIAISPGYLFVGTDDGVFVFSAYGNTWKLISQGLSGQKVSSLVSYQVSSPDPNPGTIVGNGTKIVGRNTEFRKQLQVGDQIVAKDQSRAVKSINSDTELEVTTAFTVSLKGTVFAVNRVLAGTDRGIFRFRSHVQQWEQVRELLNVQTLAIKQDNDSSQLLAGTQDRGVFSFLYEDHTWVENNRRLPDKNIGALLVSPDNKQIFAGTANHGVFRIDNGDRWQQIGFTKPGTGTIDSKDTTVTGSRTAFGRELKPGDLIIAAGQTRVVTELTPDLELTVNTPFSPDLPPRTTFTISTGIDMNISALEIYHQPETAISSIGITVTGEGTSFLESLRPGDTILANNEIRTVKQIIGNTQLSLNRPFANSLDEKAFLTPSSSQGTIASDRTTVTGKHTNFTSQLRAGDAIIAAEQIKTVAAVNSATEITINAAYEPELAEGTPFWVPCRGQGRISSTGTTVTGVIPTDTQSDTQFTTELQAGDFIIAAEQIRTIETVNSATELIIDRAFNTNLANAPFSFFSHTVLFAATANDGVFRSDNRGGRWQAVNTGLTELNIRSLAVRPDNGYLFAGTANGSLFRSPTIGNSWQPIDAGLISRSVEAIATAPDLLLVGVGDKVFRSTDGHDIYWQRINQGLSSLNVQAIAIDREEAKLSLFAGTREGVFISHNGGQHWQPIDEGLTNPNVQVLAVSSNRRFAGTKGGLFQSTDDGKRWRAVDLGIANADIKALAFDPTYKLLYVATFADGAVRYSLNSDRPTPLGLADTNLQAIAIDPANGNIFVGTASRGIFRSSDRGNSWQQIAKTRPGTGTITSDGTNVIGTGTKFRLELRVGDRITVAGQTRTVVTISASTSMTIDTPFRPNLQTSKNFTLQTGLTNLNITALAVYPVPGTGTISSDDISITGTDTKFDTELQVGDTITVAGQTKTVTNIESNIQLTVDEAFTTNLPEGTPFSRDILFAGTAGSGILRSANQGKRWQAVNEGLTNFEIRCLAVDRYRQQILAGTAIAGVFCSPDLGDRWQPLTTGLTNTDVRAIAVDSTNIFVGGIGILLSPDGFYAVEVQPGDWLTVLRPPEAVSPGQKWRVENVDRFTGTLTTLKPDDITLYPATEDDETVSEVCTIKIPPNDQQQPILELQTPLQTSFDPATVSLYGNIVEATHGETVSGEILGSGNSATANQRFELQKPPLTYVSAPTASGTESTLTVYVNEVAWERANSLYALDKLAQGYIIRLENNGTTQVIFGDGEHGMRLPSGQENVAANYRSGIGEEGNIGAESLTILKNRPLGIEAVTNPVPATGGAAREDMAQARTNAPLTIHTLDRIVSLRDFEDFTRTFAGIAKAQAVSLWVGDSQLVHITVAAAQGATVSEDSALYQNLVEAIDDSRDPLQRVQVDSYEAIAFNLEAQILLNPDYLRDRVIAAVGEALQGQFCFEQRELAQAVTASEIIATIQSVAGVVAVDLDALYVRGSSKLLNQSLPAEKARWDSQTEQVFPAQLLFLDENSITLSTGSTL